MGVYSYNFSAAAAPAPYIEINENILELENKTIRNDFSNILKSSHLFWQFYCKISEPFQKESCFHLQIINTNLNIMGRQHIIDDLKKGVEKIRLLVIDHFDNFQDFSIYFLNRESTQLSFLSDYSQISTIRFSNPDMEKLFFKDYLLPALPTLIKTLGAEFSEVQKPECKSIHPRIVKILNIHWKQRFLVYQIAPIKIPEFSENDESVKLYDLYTKQISCDFTLISKELTSCSNHKSIECHRSILLKLEKSAFRAILENNMQESLNNVINLKEFSKETLIHFLDFAYKGGNFLLEKLSKVDEVNLVELFIFAQTYCVEDLINCCTNLYAAHATLDNLEEIKMLAELYQNQHLKQLLDYIEHISKF